MSPQAGHAARIRLLPSRGGLPPCAKSLSCVRLFATPWTAAHQAPLSMGFSRQEYWSGLPCPPPGDLPNPGVEPRSPALQVDSLPSKPPGKPMYHTERKSKTCVCVYIIPIENRIKLKKVFCPLFTEKGAVPRVAPVFPQSRPCKVS